MKIIKRLINFIELKYFTTDVHVFKTLNEADKYCNKRSNRFNKYRIILHLGDYYAEGEIRTSIVLKDYVHLRGPSNYKISGNIIKQGE